MNIEDQIEWLTDFNDTAGKHAYFWAILNSLEEHRSVCEQYSNYHEWASDRIQALINVVKIFTEAPRSDSGLLIVDDTDIEDAARLVRDLDMSEIPRQKKTDGA